MKEEIGRVGRKDIEELEFEAFSSSVVPEENLFRIHTLVTNVGNQTTKIKEYDLRATVYDGDGAELDSSAYQNQYGINEVEPDDGVDVVTGCILKDPMVVESYTVSLLCPTKGSGVYCTT